MPRKSMSLHGSHVTFLGETQIGETAMKLLIPTPIRISTTASVSNKEYVPVTTQKFSMIEVKMHTNLSTMEMYDGPHNILIVLHFIPRYKRKGTKEPSNKKPRIDDGFNSRFLQWSSHGSGVTQSGF